MTIEHRCACEQTGNRQDRTSLDISHVDALQIESSPLSGASLIRRVTVYLNATNTRGAPGRKDFYFFFSLHAAGDERACHYGAESFHRETTVHRQAEDVVFILGCRPSDTVSQCGNELWNAFSCLRADTKNW